MSGSTGGGSGGASKGGAKETFGAAKKAFNDSKSNGGQGNPNGGQVEDNQEEAGSVQDTAKSSGKGKDGAKKAKDAAKRGKKFFDGLKGIQSLAPLVSALGTIGIALLIIFLIIGFIGFFTTLPGLAMEKFTEACKQFWNWVVGSETIEISEGDLVDLANYIQELGYELVGNGFASSSQIKRDKDTGEVTAVKTDYEGNPGDTPNYLYAYVLQNERMYTLRGVKKSGIGHLLSWIPGISAFEDWIENSVRNSNYLESPESYGMLHFDPDDMNDDWWNSIDDFKPSIDRDNMKLTIKTGFWTVSQMNWDLDGWTGRYGKPIELSLALHLSTMAPDFVYDFCMDSDLQTDIELGAKEVEYTADYTYISNDGLTLTRDEVIAEFNDQKKAVSVNSCYDSLFSENLKLEPFTWYDGTLTTATIDTIDNTNIICVNNIKTGDTACYKALDKDGKPVSFATRNGELISYDIEFDGSGQPTFTEDSDDGYSWNLGSDSNEIYGGKYDITIESISIQDMIFILSGGDDLDKYNVLMYLLIETNRYSGISPNSYGLEHLLYAFDECIKYINTEKDDIYWYQPEDGYYQYFLDKSSKIIDEHGEGLTSGPDYFRDRNDVDKLCEEMKELLGEIKGRLKQDIEDIENWVEPVIAIKTAELNQWGLDAETFLLLYNVMTSQSTSVHTFKPYINKVTHHWYKDVYFNPDKDDYKKHESLEDFDSAYDFTKEMEDVTGEYNPEGLADTEDIQKLKETGKIMYTLNGTGDNSKDVVQVKQPFIIRTEKWHNKVKNWLTSGYFFIYDGTEETAKEIESARKVLKDEYDPSNPLLISYENKELLIDSENNEKPEVAVIDARAKELNDILASTEYKDGKKYKVRLQKINFAKKSSLAAFSILESVHTKDGEYVYRDLKEFMIELGYFTEADFKLIESGVLDWIIPEYVPDEWPDKRYEKKNDEYGTFIRSRTSIEAEREEEEKKLEEAHNKENELEEGNTGVSDGGPNSSEKEPTKTEESNKSSAPISRSAVYEEYAESGDGYQTIITVNGITYKNFKQGYFSNVPYNGNSVASDGCGATSVTIVLSGYGFDVTVPEVATWMNNTRHLYT